MLTTDNKSSGTRDADTGLRARSGVDVTVNCNGRGFNEVCREWVIGWVDKCCWKGASRPIGD